MPAAAATSPELPTAATYDLAAGQAVGNFYARRGNAPLWLRNGADSVAARAFIGVKIMPGSIALTLIFKGAHSSASVRVRLPIAS